MAQDHRQSSHPIPGIRRPISEESWIEVSSRPSSSSLSSAAADEVVTTGLRVSQNASQRRRRRLFRSATTQLEGRVPLEAPSPEEYEESEADSDRVMSSSNEDLQPRFAVDEAQDTSPVTAPRTSSSDGDSLQDDEDDIATALGPVDGSPVFTPQPNAFSHPPSARLTRDASSYFPPLPSSQASSSRPSTSRTDPRTVRQHQRPQSHTPFNAIAPNASMDHDAALRASLSTLLSCAAAARGITKRDNASGTSRSILPSRARSNRIDQGTLRIIPESALAQIEEHRPHSSPPISDTPGSPIPSKRKSKSPIRDRRKRSKSAYGMHNEDIMNVSPTLTTWVVGAGVLVLFSAISFTAGYHLGKEVGRVDAMTGNAMGCGSEVDTGNIGRGLARRSGWRGWGNASGVRA